MAKITYTSLQLKTNTDVKTVDFNGHSIEVLQYLPIEDKYDLITITAQNALQDGIYHPLLLDELFHLYLVFMYSNITFTAKQKENLNKLYDTLKSSGLMDLIIQQIPENEYNELFTQLEEYVKFNSKYNRSAAGLINSLITDLPKQAQMAKEIIAGFDPNQYQNVIEFAKAANGDREI